MPAGSQTGGSYYIPGKGTTTRSKSGKAKSYQGSGPAPSGAAKEPEATYKTAPTLTVSPDGSVSTSGYKSQRAAKAAERKQERSEARVKRIVALVTAPAQKASQAVAPKAPVVPKIDPMKVPHDYSVPASQDPRVLAAERADAPKVQVAGRVRSAPKGNVPSNPAQARISSVPGKNPNLKGTPAQRKAARARVQQAKKVVRQSRVAAKLPIPFEESPEQQQNARTVLKIGKHMGASKKELMAAAETGIVEAPYFKNPTGGDADSEGWRQERTSIYGTGPTGPTNVKASAKRFFEEAKTDPTIPGGGGETSGELAQTVQGSAYPERYEEHKSEAAAIVKAFYGGQPNKKAIQNLKGAKAEARELGLKVGGSGVGKAPPKVVKKYDQALTTMKAIDAKHYEYQWGGGHTGVAGEPVGGPGVGFDCSGAVSAMLHSVHDLEAPLVSGSMGQALDPGPGAITVFYNGVHTFAYIPALKKYWGTSESNPGGGAGFFPKSVGDSEVASGNSAGAYSVGHVPGLGKKQALQLGALPGSMTAAGASSGSSTSSSQPFPGMTLSESGTSASIDKGKGKKQKEIGFSNQPLTVAQTEQKLEALSSPQRESASTSVLDSLERKYGSAG